MITAEKSKTACKRVMMYSSFFLLIAMVVFGYIFTNDRSTILAYDGTNYLIPCWRYIREWVNLILHRHFDWYSFNIGFGENVLETQNWSGLGDPFFLLLNLFEEQRVFFVNSLITFLKLYLSGIAVLYALRNKAKTDEMLVLCALVYVFSKWMFTACANPSFVSAGLTFPLIISGVENVLKEKKIDIILVLSVFYQALCGFYFLYIELIYAAIFVIVWYIIDFLRSKRFDIIKALMIVGHVFLGMGMASISFIPSLVGYFKCPRNGIEITLPLIGILPSIGEIFEGVCVPSPKILALSLTFVVLLLFLYSFLDKRIDIFYKIMSILSILMLYSSIVGMIMNGFSIPHNDRYQFVPYFFIVLLISQIESLESITRNKWVWLVFLVLSLVGVVYSLRENRIYIIIPMLVASIGVCIIGSKKDSFILGISVINIMLNVVIALSTYGYIHGYFYDNSSIRYALIQTDIYNIYADDAKGYRLDIYESHNNIENVGMFKDVYSCSEYLSMVNYNLYDFYRKYGLLDSSSNGLRYHGLDSRRLFEDFFATKYYWDRNNNTVVENKDYINWGTVYDNYIDQSTFDTMNYIERYDSLSKYAVIDTSNNTLEFKPTVPKEKTEFEECDFKIIGENTNGNNRTVTIKKGEEVTFEVDLNICEGDEIFLSADSIEWDSQLYYGDLYISDKYIELSNQKEMFIKVFPDENGKFNMSFDRGEQCTLKNIRLYKYNSTLAAKYLQEKNMCYEVQVASDEIDAKVDGAGKIVCFSVLYDKNWRARINGVNVPVIRMNNGMLGVVTIGEENNIHIDYHYSDNIVLYGVISLFSTLMFSFLVYKRRYILFCDVKKGFN